MENGKGLIPGGEAAIVRRENIAAIAQAGPEAYQANAASCRRCAEAGLQLLDEIERGGMDDDLDRRLAAYVEKARKTVKAMNERRSPVTKLFDQVRAEYTMLENEIDPAKKDTVPYRIARHRDSYAAKKREQEERRRQEELAAQELRRAIAAYRLEVEDDYRRAFNALVAQCTGELARMAGGLTLENYTAVADTVTGYWQELPAGWQPASAARPPQGMPPGEEEAIRTGAFRELRPGFERQFASEVGGYRLEILDRLPSKKRELERMAEAEADEAARIKEEMERREAAEAARKEREREQAEAETRQKAEAGRQAAEMDGLFAVAKAQAAGYAPKTKVSKRIRVHAPDAYLAIVSLWWQHEGCALPAEELAKVFKKQVAFCEKLATKEGTLVKHPGLEYYDEVKAR